MTHDEEHLESKIFILCSTGGGLMNFNSSELSEFGRAFYRNSSPTDALLTSWGNQNHTLLELFILFAKLDNFRAMRVISRFGMYLFINGRQRVCKMKYFLLCILPFIN